MKKWIQTNWGIILFGIIGAIGGFFYWRYVGCQSGTCVIQSTWNLSTLWGAALGGWVGSFFSGKNFCMAEKCKSEK